MAEHKRDAAQYERELSFQTEMIDALISERNLLLESLDNASASLETVLTHHSRNMPESDQLNRWRITEAARELVGSIRSRLGNI